MTRKKKTRSLKRIHSVKTGTPSKLKRASTMDRQSTNLKAKNKPKSVYQKFLDENPDAVEKQQPKVAVEEGKNKPSKKKAKPEPKVKPSQKKKDDERSEEREPDLLSQLDNKNLNDFY